MPKSTFSPAYAEMLAILLSARHKASVTQIELARRLGKPQAFISNVERGARRLDIIEFYAFARALGADPQALFGGLVAKLPKKVSI